MDPAGVEEKERGASVMVLRALPIVPRPLSPVPPGEALPAAMAPRAVEMLARKCTAVGWGEVGGGGGG